MLVLAALSPASASAKPKAPPPPIPPAPGWQITGTSTVPQGEAPIQQRVEARALAKEGRGVARVGFSYLSRGDFYNNPAVAIEGTYYLLEWVGIDVSGTIFVSHLNETAAELRRSTGLLPDSQKPVARVMVGSRFALIYGKALVETLGTIVHFDASLNVHFGILKTEPAFNPALDLGIGLQALAYQRLLVFTELAWILSYEARTTTNFASGPMMTVGAGFLF
jgi:hypothetical protein